MNYFSNLKSKTKVRQQPDELEREMFFVSSKTVRPAVNLCMTINGWSYVKLSFFIMFCPYLVKI